MRSQSAAEISRNFTGWVMPALLIKTSMPPKDSITRATACSQDDLSATLHPSPVWEVPSDVAASAAAPASMSRMATRAPSPANRRAVASPIPRGEAAPEMMAVLPLSSISSSHEFILPWQGKE
ncbi:hypothetical protein ACVWZK_000384 [Bradyrhizobium sp. GM0.4]